MIARRSLPALFVALAAAAAGAAVWLLALHTDVAGRPDSIVLHEFYGVGGERTKKLAHMIVGLVDPAAFIAAGVLLCGIALVRRSWWRALAAAAVLAGSTLTAQALQTLLASPRPFAAPAGLLLPHTSWPSGHATAAMALALCLVLVCPARLRPFAAAAGGAFGVAVAYALQVSGWHYASDVIGGFLVAAAWFALGIAALRAIEGRADGARVGVPAAVAPTVLIGIAGAALAAVVLERDPLGWFTRETDLTALVAALGAIGAAGLAAAAAAAAALRRIR